MKWLSAAFCHRLAQSNMDFLPRLFHNCFSWIRVLLNTLAQGWRKGPGLKQVSPFLNEVGFSGKTELFSGLGPRIACPFPKKAGFSTTLSTARAALATHRDYVPVMVFVRDVTKAKRRVNRAMRKSIYCQPYELSVQLLYTITSWHGQLWRYGGRSRATRCLYLF